MTGSYLTLRLSDQDAQLIEQLCMRTGKSKSETVRHALQELARNHRNQVSVAPAVQGLYALGESRFGKYGDASRQSAELKSVVRAGHKAKRRA